jgi:hypothetical protein
MPQLFSPPALLGLKFTLLVVLTILAAAWIALYKALPPPGGALSPRQPIQFSHKHHAGDDGIDCRYCHYSVEKSSFAGIPSTEICLTCHAQLFADAPVLAPLRESARTGRPIAWVRVHRLPDFVFFNHSIHVAKGLPCSDCHGDVAAMPRIVRVASLEMQWCLGCHRTLARERHLDERRLTDCSTCHR